MLVVLTEGRSEPRRTRLVIVRRCGDVARFRIRDFLSFARHTDGRDR